MKEITQAQEGTDFEIKVISNQMEVRLANDFRKRIKAAWKRDRINGAKSLLPESFKITGSPGILEPIEIRGESFTSDTSWRLYFPTEDLPTQLSSDLSGYSISYLFVPPKEGYLYWDRDNGEIKGISAQLIEDQEMSPFVLPLEEILPFLSGDKKRHDYYIGPAKKKGKLELKKKAPDFTLVTDITRLSNLSEITEENSNPDIEVSWNNREGKLSIRLLTEVVPYHKHWLNFYVTKRNDPYYLFQTLKIQIVELLQSENRELMKEIDTDVDISIYTNLVFDNYNLVRENA